MLAEMVNNQPLLIHCSAGVGRTGLLMGTIAALNSVKPNETRSALDIANQIVLDMRLSASPTMVQTVEQFAALVNAVRAIINEKIINQAIE
nr:tyrosine-protein phosphatase [Providencia stuartii]